MHELLQDWLPQRRWFAGKGRPIASVAVSPSAWLVSDPAVRIELVQVTYADGGTEIYQVPVEYRAEPAEALAHALIGQATVDELGPGPCWAYDALHDKSVTNTWLHGMHEGRHEPGPAGTSLTFHQEPAAAEFPLDEPSLVLTAEQSNTSLVFGDHVILKVFRRLAEGLNPDVELHHALAEAGNTFVAPLLGWVDGTWPDAAGGEPRAGTFAIAQEFLKSATGGWELALSSIRDLFASPDLSPGDAGGDFAGDAYRLGEATAAVHADLARTLGSQKMSRTDLVAVAKQMTDTLADAVEIVPELGAHAESISRVYADLAEYDGTLSAQRVHGDLHLGQAMRVLTGWKIIDFEGEPARPVAERRRTHCPLKDVAGMLRSLDYAARHLLADHGQQPDPKLELLADEWARRNSDAYCTGYSDTLGRDITADALPLRAFTLDKAVYEVVYEARNRPAWLPVPMSAIARLTS
jgi:maltokinase